MIEPLASSSPVGFKSSVMHPFPSARPDRFDPMLLYLYPATALAIITPIYLLFSGDGERQDTRRREHGSRRSKLARAVVLLVCELILAGFDAMESDMAASYCFVAICMPSIASLALSLDYFYQQPSPMLLRTYMITVCFADVAQIWNYQLSANNWVVSLLSLCTALVNATLLLSETYVKSPGSITSISTDFLREKSEDELSNRSLLERLRGLLGFGFRTWTTVDDLPQLADELSVATLSRDFEPIWASTNKQSSLALLKAILRSLGWSLIDVVPPRLLHVSLQMYMNFLVRRVLVFVSEHGVGQDDTKDNIILTMSLTLSAMTVASVWHTYMRGRLNVTLNGLLRSRILRKNLAVPSSEAIASQATTHLNTSVDEILAAMPYFHDFWLAPLEILLGLYLFHNFEGVLTYFMFPPLFVSATMAYYIAQRNIRATSRWRAATDNRLNRTNEILPHLKSLRMLGLDQPIIDYLQAYRGVEISASKGHNVHLILTWLCTSVAVYVSKMAVFAGGIYWTSSMMPIDAARVFIGSYLVYIIVQPTYALIQRGPLMKATFSSLKRLQGYFLSLESNESRALRDQNHSTSEPSDAAVVFCNASIGPEDSDVPLIERVTSTVKKGTFVVVSGPVGSGKSLFLKAIAGAARVLHGSLEIVGDAKSVSYCGQTPWLPNQSIKDTIVGNHEYDHDWYITVITACQLKREIDRLPGHHNLRIGLGGRNLSSGQRQRLALARAIYSRAPILVLDDVFSVLDHPTLLAIISALFKERGLLAKMHTTVFLATRAAEFFRLTHHIFDLDAHHNVHVANGKLETGKVFSNKINRKELSHNRQEYSVGPGDQLAVPESPDQDANQPPHMVPHSPEIPNSHHFLFFKSVSPWIFSLFLLLNAAAATWEGMPDTFARYWADHAPKDPSYFGYYILIVSFHWPLISSVAGLFLFCIVPKCALDLHLRFLVAIMRTPLAVVTSMSQDADLSQLARLIAPVGFDMPWALNTTAYRTFLSCAYIALVVHGIPRFLYAVPLCLVFTASIALAFLRGARQINGLYERARASLNLALKEASSGLEHIRSMGLSEDYLAKGLQALDQLQSCLSAKAQLQVWLMLFLQLLTSFILLTITILAVYYPSSTLTAGGVGLAFCSTQLIWLVLQNLLNSASGFDNLISFISRLLSFIEKTPVPDTNPAEMPEKWGRSCEIVLDNINAAYRTPSTEYTALHGISLTIPAGKKVGIIGRTGSGKSSLILALLNELEYTGSIKIDNVELSNISRDLIHSVTTVIPQEFARIPGTVRDNVYPWDLQKNPDERSATDEQIIQVLQQVGLWPYIEQQGGLGILLAAVKLSGGEKRLLGIARGILHHQIAQTKLVLMDEATSELDKETETKVNAVMMEAFSGCTVLAVTHYSQILQDTQVLVEVRDGRLTVLRED